MTSIPITFPGVAPDLNPPTYAPTPPTYVPPVVPPTYVPEPPAPFNPAPKGYPEPAPPPFDPTPTYVPEPPVEPPFNPEPPVEPPFDPIPLDKGWLPPLDPTPPQYVPEPPTSLPEQPVVPPMGMPPMGQSPVSLIAQILTAIQNSSNGMPTVLGGMPGVASPAGAPMGRPQTPWEPPLGSPLGSPMGGVSPVGGGMPLSPYNSDAFPVGGTPQPRQGAPMGLANLLRRFQRAGGRSQLDGLRSKYSGGY